jgi:hypothetical protein
VASLTFIKKNFMYQKLVKIEDGLWLYKGCFIQKIKNPMFMGDYEVFKNNEHQHYVAMCFSFTEARKMCAKNECFDNYLKFTLHEQA